MGDTKPLNGINTRLLAFLKLLTPPHGGMHRYSQTGEDSQCGNSSEKNCFLRERTRASLFLADCYCTSVQDLAAQGVKGWLDSLISKHRLFKSHFLFTKTTFADLGIRLA